MTPENTTPETENTGAVTEEINDTVEDTNVVDTNETVDATETSTEDADAQVKLDKEANMKANGLTEEPEDEPVAE